MTKYEGWSHHPSNSLEECPQFCICSLVLVAEHVVTGVRDVDQTTIRYGVTGIKISHTPIDVEIGS